MMMVMAMMMMMMMMMMMHGEELIYEISLASCYTCS
jgi:hypothetical protein